VIRRVTFLMCALTMGVLFAASSVVPAFGQSAAQTINGLEMSIGSVTRADNVSLGDCPPGANIVRGVIRPGDTREYATVTIDVKVTPSFDASAILTPPTLQDDAGTTFRTAQAFTDMGSPETYSCGFSFRVPKGAALTTLTIGETTFDLAGK